MNEVVHEGKKGCISGNCGRSHERLVCSLWQEDQNYGRVYKPRTIVLENSKRQLGNILEDICSDLTKICYTISDSIDTDRHVFLRSLSVKGTVDEAETLVALKVPSGKTVLAGNKAIQMLCWVTYFEPILELIDSDATQSDTRKWEVQHLQPQAQYIATMIVASFATSALSFNAGNNLSSNVVLIGLGGGSLSMFLREKFTMVNATVIEIDPTVTRIAQRWFQAVNDSGHLIIVGDGRRFLEDAASKGQRFDVIFLDACGSDKLLSCPLVGFLADNVLMTIAARILSPSGAFVFNLLSEADEEMVFEMVSYFEVSHFYLFIISFVLKRFGMVSRLIEEANTVVACIPSKSTLPTFSHPEFAGRSQRLWKDFEFDRIFGDDEQFTIVNNKN
ncbi:unnamed protein product [Enterobius vermicularis]|uniref:PABS domain-containing protein n=1 Tax=Enterobius vermicularis TaxID=51028 RepID=A0A0N4V1Q7_ENTVE|nr:unnamed protein product [Enterobius vermicularis]